jgi:hypothetical protein
VDCPLAPLASCAAFACWALATEAAASTPARAIIRADFAFTRESLPRNDGKHLACFGKPIQQINLESSNFGKAGRRFYSATGKQSRAKPD